MLLEFTVSNFRSIADEQTLSLLASSSSVRESDDLISYVCRTENNIAPFALNAVCILGSNGAGKSNILKALDFFQRFVSFSKFNASENEGSALSGIAWRDFSTFSFDEALVGEGSKFEIKFLKNGTFYQYGYVIKYPEVVGEWLYSRNPAPRSKLNTVFERWKNEETGKYDWLLPKLSETYSEIFKRTSRDNLVISIGDTLKLDNFSNPFKWISNSIRLFNLRNFNAYGNLGNNFTSRYIKDGNKENILERLRNIDIDIKDIFFEDEVVSVSQTELPLFTESEKGNHSQVKKRSKVYSVHRDRHDKFIQLPFTEESDGTQRIYSVIGPMLHTLENGYVLIVDELDASLHPGALRSLVALFNNPKVNTSGAQLVFTAHDSNLLSGNLLHRDQIWFVEKDATQASRLYPLSDFKPRQHMALQKAYLEGRFGAVPFVKDNY